MGHILERQLERQLAMITQTVATIMIFEESIANLAGCNGTNGDEIDGCGIIVYQLMLRQE